MSKIISETGRGGTSHVVQSDDGKLYVVDSRNTFDVGLEIMVFKYDKEAGCVAGNLDLYCEHPKTCEEMALRRNYICSHIEEFI